ncbi:hypothetical protein LEP1GSC059_2781 [Leptospira noguchii serovar Panama str. CZ214]|uniref:Uncharacterized protein n=1 Tax=Leptospira noguchii serovar Panama str. CZ214 TaxID=1001595 RepID=T0GW36_9LEPT|nr:hypothetical protein LEP1GSC059_2781 [Leptospira noguchii serovar Panama str. CZ214]
MNSRLGAIFENFYISAKSPLIFGTIFIRPSCMCLFYFIFKKPNILSKKTFLLIYFIGGITTIVLNSH